MTDPRITAALAKLDHGTWSLTVGGFARKALRMPDPMTPADRKAAHQIMMETGLPHRRVPFGGGMVDVWDFDAP